MLRPIRDGEDWVGNFRRHPAMNRDLAGWMNKPASHPLNVLPSTAAVDAPHSANCIVDILRLAFAPAFEFEKID